MNKLYLAISGLVAIVAAGIFFLWAQNQNNTLVDNISCSSRYDVFLNGSSLNSVIVISMVKDKGTFSLIGDYYFKKIKKIPVRIYTNFISHRIEKKYSAKMTASLIVPKELVRDPTFMNMLNLLMFRENTIAIYEIIKQNNGTYVFYNGGKPSFTCNGTQ